MTQGYLEFKANWYEWDEEFYFEITASNQVFKVTHNAFYGEESWFQDFAKQLVDFPKSQDQVVKFEAGKENEKGWLNHFMIKVFCFDPNGHCAIEILSEDNSEPPSNYRINFSLNSEAAAINRLGKALLDWNPKETETLLWENTTN
ncbi:hypothetical protein I5M27_15590 [Adhaeribacter sp. BT258]|uniref:Uncharacterized protein n=1 Tax=Adhaeribacter terrigena TaxID=2793070 RepID=A0ABS1C5D5_9BACT|nr:hypothetical protein [Adhaeribacter terrigena]MBK0404421.1 hypothetical protein [Adhaeribacter terrigena]